MSLEPPRQRDGVAARLEQATSPQERFQIMHTELRDRIAMLDYPPGTQLGEEALASEFGVSRSPLRKALQILEADGLLQSQQGVGTLVTDVDLDELIQVYQLRLELNELAGKLSPADVDDRLRRGFADMTGRATSLRAAPGRRAFARLNIDFFEQFQELSGNRPLREFAERLFYQTCRIWLTLIPDDRLEDEVGVFCDEIGAIADAVSEGDVAAAALIRRAHLSMGFNRLRAHRHRQLDLARTGDGAT